MKKPYMKPALYAESFRLVEHIASCEFQAHHGAEDMCSFTDAGIAMFRDAHSCSPDAESMWTFAGITDLDQRTYANLGSLGLSGQPCYNSFQDYTLLISS